MESHDASGDESAAESRREASAIAEDLFCPECAYNLRGAVGDRCPECGHPLDALRTQRTPIPWQQRAERGRIVSYVLTLWQVTFRTRLFCDNIAHPVSYRDAQWFRWTTVALAFLPAVLATGTVYGLSPPKPAGMTDVVIAAIGYTTTGRAPVPRTVPELAYDDVWPAALLNACFLLFLAAATGLPSYIFHPRSLPVSQQNRAIAMSYYTCAPLVLTIVPIALGAAAWILSGARSRSDAAFPVAVSAAVTGLLIVLVWLRHLERLARRTMPHLRSRCALALACMPLLWAVAAGLTMVGLPSIVVGIAVVVASLF